MGPSLDGVGSSVTTSPSDPGDADDGASVPCESISGCCDGTGPSVAGPLTISVCCSGSSVPKLDGRSQR